MSVRLRFWCVLQFSCMVSTTFAAIGDAIPARVNADIAGTTPWHPGGASMAMSTRRVDPPLQAGRCWNWGAGSAGAGDLQEGQALQASHDNAPHHAAAGPDGQQVPHVRRWALSGATLVPPYIYNRSARQIRPKRAASYSQLERVAMPGFSRHVPLHCSSSSCSDTGRSEIRESCRHLGHCVQISFCGLASGRDEVGPQIQQLRQPLIHGILCIVYQGYSCGVRCFVFVDVG